MCPAKLQQITESDRPPKNPDFKKLSVPSKENAPSVQTEKTEFHFLVFRTKKMPREKVRRHLPDEEAVVRSAGTALH